MRRTILIIVAAVTLAATGCAAHAATTEPARPTPATHQHTGQTAPSTSDRLGLAAQLAGPGWPPPDTRPTWRAAKADGYQIITRMIPDMGWHFLNPAIQGFDVTKPPILVYERHGHSWQLGALEWVFTRTPATPPLPGATYGSFAAACHYKDGTFVAARVQAAVRQAQPPDRCRASTSGTPTWSPCTSGSGTPTPTASTAAPTPTSSPSTTARPPIGHQGRDPSPCGARVPASSRGRRRRPNDRRLSSQVDPY